MSSPCFETCPVKDVCLRAEKYLASAEESITRIALFTADAQEAMDAFVINEAFRVLGGEKTAKESAEDEQHLDEDIKANKASFNVDPKNFDDWLWDDTIKKRRALDATKGAMAVAAATCEGPRLRTKDRAKDILLRANVVGHWFAGRESQAQAREQLTFHRHEAHLRARCGTRSVRKIAREIGVAVKKI